jgi:hypothetical protein
MHDSPPPPDMSKVVGIICLMLCLTTVAGFVTPVSAQVLPEVILECDDGVEINPITRMALVYCTAENPSLYNENIDIQIESGGLDSAGPESITIGGGDTVDFQVALRSDEAESPGEILVNITATVTQANGIPQPIFAASDAEEVVVTIIQYLSCEAEIGQGGGTFDSGDEISISASISCISNEESEVSYQIHLIEKDMGSSSWPSGFQNINGDCEVEVEIGDTGENCNFKIGSPNDLGKDWEGCMIIIEKGDLKPNSCPNTNKVDLKIKKKVIGIGIELGGNESILEQLGITEEQVPVIAGSIGILVLIIGGFMYYRQKGREYE